MNEKTLLIVNGSPHDTGPTAMLIKALVSALPEHVRTVSFDCFKRMPRPCIDCGACRSAPCCAFDDLEDYHTALAEAAGLVFASPVYNMSFPAPMKALIDRGQRYWSRRFVLGSPEFTGARRPAILLTAAGSERSGGSELERQLRPALTVLNAELVRCIHYEGSDKGVSAAPFEEQARQAGQYLAAL